MKIYRVSSESDKRRFASFPSELYRGDPSFVPVPRALAVQGYEVSHNSFLRGCEHQLFLCADGKRVLGRVSAAVDKSAVERAGKRIGTFGDFECIDNGEVAGKLLHAAETFLVGKRCVAMRGPFHLNTREWGVVSEGFRPSPVVLAPHSRPYYDELMTGTGLQVATELRSYVADLRQGFAFAPRGLEMVEALSRREELQLRKLSSPLRAADLEVLMEIRRKVKAVGWGMGPTMSHDSRIFAKDAQAESHYFVCETGDGKAVGYAVLLPDTNVLLRRAAGKLLGSWRWKTPAKVRALSSYRLWPIAVVPERQGKLFEGWILQAVLQRLGGSARVEICAMPSDDQRGCNALERMGLAVSRRYNVYEKSLL